MTDTYIPLRDVPKLRWIPRRRGGARLALPTLWRWSTRGVRGIRLRIVRIGSTPATTEQWLHEFFAALGEPANAVAHPAQQSAQRQREIAAAQARLAAAGIG